MHSDREIKNRAVAKVRTAELRMGQHRYEVCPTRVDMSEGHCLNKYPFTPTWSSARPVPVGRIPVQVRPSIDRIQVNIFTISGVLAALREKMVQCGFAQKGVFTEAHPRSGKLETKYCFEMDGSQIYLIRPEGGQHAFWYRMLVCQPTPKVQAVLHDVLDILPRFGGGKKRGRAPWYVSQIEIALDARPTEGQYLGLVRSHIESGLTLPGARSKQCGRSHETSYLGRHGNIREGGFGIRIYRKSEDAQPDFIRCEVQLNSRRLEQLGLKGTLGLLVSPHDVNLPDHLQYRFMDTKRLDSSLKAKFGERSERFNWYRAAILRGGSVAAAQDAMRDIKKRYPGIKLERIFLASPKQRQLFEDLSQGFVRPRYRMRPFPKTAS